MATKTIYLNAKNQTWLESKESETGVSISKQINGLIEKARTEKSPVKDVKSVKKVEVSKPKQKAIKKPQTGRINLSDFGI